MRRLLVVTLDDLDKESMHTGIEKARSRPERHPTTSCISPDRVFMSTVCVVCFMCHVCVCVCARARVLVCMNSAHVCKGFHKGFFQEWYALILLLL